MEVAFVGITHSKGSCTAAISKLLIRRRQIQTMQDSISVRTSFFLNFSDQFEKTNNGLTIGRYFFLKRAPKMD